MYRAFGTGRLVLLKRAFVKAFKGIVQKLFTFGTQSFAEMMLVAVSASLLPIGSGVRLEPAKAIYCFLNILVMPSFVAMQMSRRYLKMAGLDNSSA